MSRFKRFLATVVTFILIMTMLPVAQTEVYAAKKMKLNKKKITLTVGKKKTLKVKNKPKSVKVKWKSKNKKIAKVSKKGVVRAKKAGKTTIIAKVGKKTLRCRVIVKKKSAPVKRDDVAANQNPENAATTLKPTTEAPAVTTAQPTKPAQEQTTSAAQVTTQEAPSVTESKPAENPTETTTQSKPEPAETTTQSKPAETTTQPKPAETTTQSKPVETTTDSKIVTLPDVAGLTYSGNKDYPYRFAWAPVDEAEGYRVYVNNARIVDVIVTYIDIDSSYFPTAGTYTIGVQAFAKDAVSKISTITFEVKQSEQTSADDSSVNPLEPSQTETKNQGQTDIYADVPFLADGARNGALNNTYKAVVMSGDIEPNNIQEFQGIVAIHNILKDADIGNVTVNGKPSTGKVDGAGVFINIDDLTLTDNEVIIYTTSGAEKGVIRIYNAKAGGGSTQPSSAAPQSSEQQPSETETKNQGQTDIYADVPFLADGARNGALNNTYKAVVTSGDIQPNNIQEFQGIVAIHNILKDADIGTVTVNGKPSTGKVEGAGVFINIDDLTLTDNEVKIYTTSGAEKGVIRIYNAKAGGGSTQPSSAAPQSSEQQPSVSETQDTKPTETQQKPVEPTQPVTPQPTTATVFVKDPSLPVPFGMIVSNPDSGIIFVNWGKGEINCYNVYVDGVRKRTKVTAGGQNIPVQTEGKHQVSIATATPDGRESEWVTMEVDVKGVAAPETTDYPEELKPQIDPNIPKESGKMVLQLNNKTNGQYSDSQIYWIVVGRNPDTHQLAYVDAKGNLINADLSLNNAEIGSRKYSKTIIHSLADANYVHLPAIESGRMYLSYGEPVYITFNQGADGSMGYAGPDVNNISDANYNTLFEYLEFTTEAVNGSIRFHGNTTRVDFFSFPIMTRLTDEYGGYDRCVGDIGTRDEIFNAFRTTVSEPFKTLVGDKRIMAPAKTTFREDGQYSTYFDDYINRFWTKYTNEDLVFNCEGGTFKGRVEGDRLRFTKSGDGTAYYVNKPTTQDVLEGRGAFNEGNAVEKVIESQLCAAFNRGIAMQPENYGKPSTFYKSGEICNEYAAFFHEHSVSARAYGFCYDDVADQSTLVECDNAAALTIDLNW